MNYQYLTCVFHANSQEQRERLFKEIYDTTIDDEKYCSCYRCERDGECDIDFHVHIRGTVTDSMIALVTLPRKYPGVSMEIWYEIESWGLEGHWIYRHECWERLLTANDIINEYNFIYGDFDPSMLELNTYRDVYDYDGNLISEESETVPFPPEKMTDEFRMGYEEWKLDPVKWQEDHNWKPSEPKQWSNEPLPDAEDLTADDDTLDFLFP